LKSYSLTQQMTTKLPVSYRNSIQGHELAHPHPIHTNIALHRLATKNFTPPIPTAAEKQPKPKNQTHPSNRMGREHSKATHPHKEKEKRCSISIGFNHKR